MATPALRATIRFDAPCREVVEALDDYGWLQGEDLQWTVPGENALFGPHGQVRLTLQAIDSHTTECRGEQDVVDALRNNKSVASLSWEIRDVLRGIQICFEARRERILREGTGEPPLNLL